MTTSPVGHRHLIRSLGRGVLVVAGIIVAPALIIEGDLLVLPAAALVVFAWVVIALIALTHWLLTVGAPPLLATTRTSSRAGWEAIADDPIGRTLHRWTDRLARRIRPALPAARWLRRRVSLTPTGLVLTLTVLITVVGLYELTVLGDRVSRPRSPVSLFDLRVAEVASRLQLRGERRVMEALTNVGATRSVLLLAAVLAVGAVVAGRLRSAVLLVAPLSVSSLLVTILKDTHARPRPALGQLVEHSTSFPSGHAAASLSLAFGIVLWWWSAPRRRPSLVAAVVVPLALLIGFSRAYLSIHWLSDVLAGWLCATVAAASVLGLDRLTQARCARRTLIRPRALTAAGAVAALIVAIVVVTGNHDFPAGVPAPEPTRITAIEPGALLPLLPQFSETLLGRRMEPVGLVIVASDDELRAAIDHAGWTVADTLTPGRLLHTYWAGITNHPDATAPVTPTFLDTRLEDLAIQQQSLGRGVKARHHARLWRLPLLTSGGCSVWGVTASLDDRVEWTLRTLFPNHHIDPAIDTERDYVAGSLAATGQLDDAGRYRFVEPTLGTNAAGDPFFTDGKVAYLQSHGCA